MLSDLNSEEIQVLKKQHRALWKFYVFISKDLVHAADRAGEVCDEVFGLPNELPHEMRGRLL